MGNKFVGKPTQRNIKYSIIKELYHAGKTNKFLIEANNFLKEYPDDASVHYLRGTVYRDHEKYNEAINDFKLADIDNNNMYAKEELFFIYYHLRMYEEALNLIPSLKDSKYITSKNIKFMTLVMKKELGLLSLHDKFNISEYSEYQILDYDKKDAYRHTKEHRYGNIKEKSSFKSNLNLEYLFELVENNLSNSKRSKEKAQVDVYYFGISNVGYSKSGDMVNFIKVIVIPNTYNVISMYPVKNVYDEALNLEYDYNKLFSKDESKVKKKSQIEKFNKRYQKSTI